MGRRAYTDPSERIMISLRGSLATRLRLVLASLPQYRDARTGLPRKGAMAEVSNEVFERWVNEHTTAPATPKPAEESGLDTQP